MLVAILPEKLTDVTFITINTLICRLADNFFPIKLKGVLSDGRFMSLLVSFVLFDKYTKLYNLPSWTSSCSNVNKHYTRYI